MAQLPYMRYHRGKPERQKECPAQEEGRDDQGGKGTDGISGFKMKTVLELVE